MITGAEGRTVAHHTFVLERDYPAALSRVFEAFADPVIKRRWFAGGEGVQLEEFGSDFRIGGRERLRLRLDNGDPVVTETTYHDIVPDQRIVSDYSMTVADRRISVSLTTIELSPAAGGTHLIYTEQGAYLDGADQPADRERGCRDLLEKLAAELAGQTSGEVGRTR
jgi:uncharacterized protein YndB with AHSA1/START domain